jgi:Biotin-protein ligase, N terminal
MMNKLVSNRITMVSVTFFLYLLLSLALVLPVSADGAKLRVALFVDEGTEASEFRKEFRRSYDDALIYRKIDGQAISNGALNNFDALVVPGGSASEESASLGAEARREICRFVREGGIYMGVCAGAYLASSQRKHDLGLLPLTTVDSVHWFRVDDGRLVDVELTAAGMEIFGISRPNIRLVYENGPIFAPLAQDQGQVPGLQGGCIPLAFFRSEVVAPGGERGVMIGAPAIVMSQYGRGYVIALSPHPEETPGFKQAELRALHWLFDHRSK